MTMEKKDLIKLYCEVKERLRRYDRDVTEAEFVKESGISTRQRKKEFVDFKDLAEIAEGEFRESLPASQRSLLSERHKKFDPNATQEDCIEDLRRLKEENPLKMIHRNFYREHGRYSDSTWNQFFGTFHEFRRQAGLELTRHQHALEKQIAKHASMDHYKKYYDEQVAPFYRKFEKEHLPSKIKRIHVISDIHDIECDEFTLEVFIAECKRKQPDIIVLNGDIADLYEFSRYTQDPRNIKIQERFQFLHNRVFGPIRAACPDAQIDYVMGNHEWRLIKHLADATPNLRILLSDVVGLTFEKIFGIEEFQINWVSKFNLAAFTKADINDILKKNHQIYFGCYAVTHEPDEVLKRNYSGTNGHHHSASYESGFSAVMGVTSWVQTPAAHVRDAEYLYKVSKWNTGFLEVTINTELKQVIQRIHATYETWTEIDGVLYERAK